MGLFSWFEKRREWKKRLRDLNDRGVKIERGFRGEGVEYMVGNKSLEMDFTWCNGDRLYTETISKWNDGQRLTLDEKKTVFVDTLDYLGGPYRKTIVVINTDDESCRLWKELSDKHSESIEKIEYWSNEQQRQFERNMYIEILNSKASLEIEGKPIKTVDQLDRVLEDLANAKNK
jgi:hypothetical protein